MAIYNQLVRNTDQIIENVNPNEVYRFSKPYGYVGIVSDRTELMVPKPSNFEIVKVPQLNLIEIAGGEPTVTTFVSKENLIKYLNERDSFKVKLEHTTENPEDTSRRSLTYRGSTYSLDSSTLIVAKRREEVFNPNDSEIEYRYELVKNNKNKIINCLIEFDSNFNPGVKIFDSNEYLEWYLSKNEIERIDLHLSEYHEDLSAHRLEAEYN